jgi:hypothetical protein
MTRSITRFTGVALLLAGSSISLAGTTVSLVGIGRLPGGAEGSDVTALSRDGSTAVGWSSSAAGTEAIRVKNGALQSLGDLPGNGVNSAAYSVSSDGSVVGGQASWEGFVPSNYYIYSRPAFIWTAVDGMQATGEVGYYGQPAFSAVTNYVSPSGQVWGVSGGRSAWASNVGRFCDQNGPSQINGASDDGSTFFGTIAVTINSTNADRPTGNRITIDQWSGVRGNSGSPSGNVNWTPKLCSADGLTGVLQATEGLYLWTSSGVTLLPLSSGLEPRAGTPSLSTLVGNTQVSGSQRAAVWTSKSGVQTLETHIKSTYGITLDTQGRSLTSCNGISGNGLVFAGSGTNASGQQEGWVLRIVYDWNDNGIDDAQEIKDGLIGDVNNDGIADCYQSGIDCPGPNIATNPGFEAGNVLGDCTSELLTAGTSAGSWQVVSGVAERANRSKSCSGSNWAAEFGTYAIELRSTGGGPGTIRQTITTEPGRHYRVSFWMSANCTSGGAVSVRASAGNSSKIFTRTCEGTDKQSWLRCELDFVAGLTTEIVEFASENQPYAGPVIDAISVSDITVGCPTDLDGNGQVDSGDISLLLVNFGPCQ